MASFRLFEFCFLVGFLNLRSSSGKTYDVHISRTELVELNPQWVADWSVYTGRHNRSSPYTFNANFTILQPVHNNVTLHIIGYERWNSNEYKEGAFVIKNKICDWMKTDKLIFPLIRYYGREIPEKCPVVGNIIIKDLVIRSEILPSYLPLRDTRLDFHFFKTESKENILKANLYFTVIERAARKFKKTKE